jgi:hypothetical protein
VKGLGVINCESSNEFGVECGGPFSNLTVNRFGGPSCSDSDVKGLGVINGKSSNELGVESGPVSSPFEESGEDSAAKANKFKLRLSYSVFSSTVIFLVGLLASSS